MGLEAVAYFATGGLFTACYSNVVRGFPILRSKPAGSGIEETPLVLTALCCFTFSSLSLSTPLFFWENPYMNAPKLYIYRTPATCCLSGCRCSAGVSGAKLSR